MTLYADGGSITKQSTAFLFRIDKSSCPRSEPLSSILSSIQQCDKIADKIEASHVWRTVQPTELALIADYRWLGQFNKKDIVIHYRKSIWWHVNFEFFSLSLINSWSVEKSRPDGFHSLLFLMLFQRPVLIPNPVGFGVNRCQRNAHLHCCHPPTIVSCSSGFIVI